MSRFLRQTCLLGALVLLNWFEGCFLNPHAAVRSLSMSRRATDGEQVGEQVVTPFEVDAADGVDYEKLIDQFGCQPITPEQLDRVEKLTGRPPHRFLRRGLFFSHRDLDKILDAYERGEPFYLYTGRGPSSKSLHLGHLVPFIFTKYLQDAFQVPLVIELTDDEKFLFKEMELSEARQLGFENARDIIAVGFDADKTFIFRDTDYIKELYPVALQIQKEISLSQSQSTFGFTRSNNIGQAIDQDPYFRLTRQVAEKKRWPKPAAIHSKFLPALQGSQSKMSASDQSTAIYVSDSEKDIRKKLKKNAASGGGNTLEEQRARGADLSKDVAYQYLRVFMEDDEELDQIGRDYESGKMTTGEIKDICTQVLQDIVQEHQSRRAQVDDLTVERFMDKARPELQAIVSQLKQRKQ